jgi:predicted nucleotidyltransferase
MPATKQAGLNDPELAAALIAFVQKIVSFPGFVSAILYGSWSRNEHHPGSDVDVAVLLAGISGEFVKTKFALNDIAYDVLLDTGIRIQPLPVWQSEWDNPDQYSNTQLLRNIAKDGIWLDSLVAGNVTQIK